MARIPFKSLFLNKQFRFQSKSCSDFEVIGYDTETIEGRVQLIANSYGDIAHPDNFFDCLDFLCRKSTRNSIGFFYNLKYDFQAILKWLEPAFWETLYKEGTIEILAPNKIGIFTIFYIPQKFLKIRYKTDRNKTRTWNFYDIAQYYGRMKLDNAAFKYLNEHKRDIHKWDLTKLTIEDMRHPEIIEYCVHDAVLAQKLAVFFIKLCNRMNLYTKNFSSPASISVRYFSTNVKFPTINRFINKPDYHSYIEYAWEATRGAFINVFKRGYFPKVYVYDINSCYPHQMRQLPDISKGRFSYRQGPPDPEFTHGWLKARVYIDPNEKGGYTPCLLKYRKQHSNFFPSGEFETYITLLEYERLKYYYELDIIDGIYWKPYNEISYFLKDAIEQTYIERTKTDDVNIRYFLKIVLNGLYGKFLEKHKCLVDIKNIGKLGMLETGNLFNPFYASYILAGSRLQLFDALVSTDPKNIIACSTDSVMTKKPMPNLDISNNLGAWSIDHEGEAIVIGCGVYSMRDKDNNLKTKLRGFHIVNVNKEDENKRDKYDLFSMIKNQHKSKEIIINTITNITPLKAIIQKMPERMNFLISDIKCININFDKKRLWLGSFKNAGELLTKNYDSLPIDYNLTL